MYKDVKYYVNDVEKYFEGWYVGIDKSTGVIIDKMTIKYLDAFMRMESMTDATVMETLRKYDEYEKSIYYENDIKERIKRWVLN